MLAALVVLTVLVGGALSARSSARRQWAAAERRLQAVRAADELLQKWTTPLGVHAPAPAAGDLPGEGGLAWATSVLAQDELAPLGLRVVRLEIVAASQADAAILRTDVVAPVPGNDLLDRAEEKEANR